MLKARPQCEDQDQDKRHKTKTTGARPRQKPKFGTFVRPKRVKPVLCDCLFCKKSSGSYIMKWAL